jgi:hypothetical protein
MSYIITGADSAGALSLKRDSAAAAIKRPLSLWGMGAETFPLPPQMAAYTVIRNSTNSIPLRERNPARKAGRAETMAYQSVSDGAGAGDKQTHSRHARNGASEPRVCLRAHLRIREQC